MTIKSPLPRPQIKPSPLDDWRLAIEYCLQSSAPDQALPLIQVVLRHCPRHLNTYVELLRALWMLGQWDGASLWARRLLRADPTQEMGWAVLARAAEGKNDPQLAHKYWRLALEHAPYHEQIRAGVLRTSLGRPAPLGLNESALATLFRLNGQWAGAAALYRRLLAQDARRPDWQWGLLEAVWRGGEAETSLELARYLVSREPNCYLGWLISMQMGDANDRALAQQPLAALDPDGLYAVRRYRLPQPQQPVVTLPTSPGEASILYGA
jgi:tetratricopeptide (TPR) repeat protein